MEKCYNRDCGNWSSDEYDSFCIDTIVVTGCSYYKPKSKAKQREEKSDMNEFDKALARAKEGTLVPKDIMDSVKGTANRMKNSALRAKVGKVAIKLIKGSIKTTPGFPEAIKPFVDSDWADIVIGAVVPVVVPMVTSNKKALRVCEDISIAAGFVIAEKLDFIDNIVKGVYEKALSVIGEDVEVEDEPQPQPQPTAK